MAVPQPLSRFEEKVHSQNGEDGVIRAIFDAIGETNGVFVEFGYHAHENNSLCLIKERKFKGLFIDGATPVPRDPLPGVNYEHAMITKSNINPLIGKHYTGPIDFLSIDVDGVDLHLADALHVVSPRVVCIEFCASIGPLLSVTVPYDDAFDRHEKHSSGWYCNASLEATRRVLGRKGYDLVGTVSGLNDFFVRSDCNQGRFRVLSTREAWRPHAGRIAKYSSKHQYETLKGLSWTRVDETGVIDQS